MVLGVLDDSASLVRASAVGRQGCGLDAAEDVQPDGTFCLVSTSASPFELRTQCADGTAASRFGPFLAETPGQITHLGLLDASRAEGDRSNVDELIAGVRVVLPALEFPPQTGERCTCRGKAECEDA